MTPILKSTLLGGTTQPSWRHDHIPADIRTGKNINVSNALQPHSIERMVNGIFKRTFERLPCIPA